MPNIQVLKPSRNKLVAGDVFTMRLPDRKYLFGRVTRTDARIASMQHVVLIYIFGTRSKAMELPDRSVLQASNLLVRPILTNHLPWGRGYFETIARFPILEGEILSHHCFRRFDGKYYDEYDHELPGPVEPVGIRGLDSFLTIDDTVSKALGFRLATDARSD